MKKVLLTAALLMAATNVYAAPLTSGGVFNMVQRAGV